MLGVFKSSEMVLLKPKIASIIQTISEEKKQIDEAVAILNEKLKLVEDENDDDYYDYSGGLDELYEKRIKLEESHY